MQELSLLQPWCPGVTATTAMQRTMSVYSNQFTALRNEAAAAAANVPAAAPDTPLAAAPQASGVSTPGAVALTAGAKAVAVSGCAEPGGPAVVSCSSGGVLHGAVLGIMGASLQAMWDAAGEEGMRPFVVSETGAGKGGG